MDFRILLNIYPCWCWCLWSTDTLILNTYKALLHVTHLSHHASHIAEYITTKHIASHASSHTASHHTKWWHSLENEKNKQISTNHIHITEMPVFRKFPDFKKFVSVASVQKYRQKCILRRFSTLSGFFDKSDWHLCSQSEYITPLNLCSHQQDQFHQQITIKWLPHIRSNQLYTILHTLSLKLSILSRMVENKSKTLVIAHATCVFSCIQKEIPVLTHKGCVLQRLSFDALSDVKVILEMRQSIVRWVPKLIQLEPGS